VRECMDVSLSRKIVLLLDCCFSGAFSVGLTHRSGDAVHALEPLGGTGTAVLTASSALEYAYEGDALSGEPTPSVFTSEIVRGLATGEADRDYDRKISVGELYEYVWDRMQAAGAKQQPRIKSDLQGELIVAGSRRERPATPLPPELFALMRSDSMTLRMKAVELLAALLSNGIRYVPTPQEALAELRDDPGSSALVSQAAAATLGGIAPRPRSTNEAPTRPVAPLVHDDAVLAIAFGPDGSQVVTACRDEAARIWDLRSDAEPRRFDHPDWVTAARLSPDGRLLATACRDGNGRIWDVESGAERARLSHDGIVWTVAFSPDGQMLATGGADETARLWTVDDGAEMICVDHETPVVAVRFNDDGRLLATAGIRGIVRLLELATQSDRASLRTDGAALALAFDGDGGALVAASGTGGVTVRSVSDGSPVARLGREPARAIALACGGRRAVTAGDDGRVQLWEVGNGAAPREIQDRQRIRAVAVAPDGCKVAVARTDHSVRIWTASR
jgi:WD domain, G-beta repeat